MHGVTTRRARSLVRGHPGTLWPWLALAVALLQTGVARAETQSPLPSRGLSLLGEGEQPAARLTLNRLTPSTPEAGTSWTDLDAARVLRVPASPENLLEQPTPLRWSANSLQRPVLLNLEEPALVTPAVMVATNWWLAYRYRTAYDITTLFPLFAVGLSLNGDLL
ncbi:hypothetical protein [Archangium sp.]|uniref:hypothetical protein n=1 Tax=Archangium sp. TaxID=1872627 RepID=UPI00286D49F2|nr:hypothetical protein [Archangium sp.]